MQRLSSQLAEAEAALTAGSNGAGGGLQGRVAAVVSAARLRAGAPAGGGGLAELETKVDDAALDQMYRILSQYTEAVGKLGEVLRRDERAVGMLEYAARGEKLP
jgi:nuclear pore complex protein Nup54